MKTFALALLIAAMLFVMPGWTSAQAQPEVDVVKYSWRKLPPSTADSDKKSQQMRISQINNMISLEKRKDPKDWDRGAIARLEEEKLRVQRNQVTLESINRSGRAYEYKFKFKNRGSKAVASLVWSFVFIDPVAGNDITRLRFGSKAQLAPGKEGALTAYSDRSPPNVVDAEAVTKFGKAWKEVVIIEEIGFSDGSKWVRTGSQ